MVVLLFINLHAKRRKNGVRKMMDRKTMLLMGRWMRAYGFSGVGGGRV